MTRVEILGADAKHAVHPREIDGHSAADGIHVPLERAAGAERHDRRPVPRRHADHRAHLVGGEWKHHGVRLPGRVPRFSVAVMLELRRIRAATVAQRFREIAHERLAAIGGEH